MMKPPPLLETILGGDGEETAMPLKGALDKLGGGDGPLSAVKMFVPPIGQGNNESPLVIFEGARVIRTLFSGLRKRRG